MQLFFENAEAHAPDGSEMAHNLDDSYHPEGRRTKAGLEVESSAANRSFRRSREQRVRDLLTNPSLSPRADGVAQREETASMQNTIPGEHESDRNNTYERQENF